MMSKDLYFIPILARALEQDDVQAACKTAFRTIDALGQQPAYRQGYYQFRQFMDDVLIGVVTERVGNLVETLDAVLSPSPELALTLAKDDVPLLAVPALLTPAVSATCQVAPGCYTLSTNTGWLLWRDELRPKDVFWTEAHPDAPLALAADSDRTIESSATRDVCLLGGELRLRVYPGVETGRLVIDVPGEKEGA
jgi:hypothetical protein